MKKLLILALACLVTACRPAQPTERQIDTKIPFTETAKPPTDTPSPSPTITFTLTPTTTNTPSPTTTPILSPTPSTGRVEGKVFRSDTNEVIPDATIWLTSEIEVKPFSDDPAQAPSTFISETKSDDKGNFLIEAVEPGEYTIELATDAGDKTGSLCDIPRNKYFVRLIINDASAGLDLNNATQYHFMFTYSKIVHALVLKMWIWPIIVSAGETTVLEINLCPPSEPVSTRAP